VYAAVTSITSANAIHASVATVALERPTLAQISLNGLVTGRTVLEAAVEHAILADTTGLLAA
jgi:hypothetical protein